jgi:hypothetical protein
MPVFTHPLPGAVISASPAEGEFRHMPVNNSVYLC